MSRVRSTLNRVCDHIGTLLLTMLKSTHEPPGKGYHTCRHIVTLLITISTVSAQSYHRHALRVSSERPPTGEGPGCLMQYGPELLFV